MTTVSNRWRSQGITVPCKSVFRPYSSLGILVFPPLMPPFPVSSSWFQDYSCAHTEDRSLDFEISATLVNFKRLYQCFVLHLIISNKELVSSGLLLIYIFIDVWLICFWKLGLYFANHLVVLIYILFHLIFFLVSFTNLPCFLFCWHYKSNRFWMQSFVYLLEAI